MDNDEIKKRINGKKYTSLVTNIEDKAILIYFDKILNQTGIESMNFFKIKKRSYHSSIGLIVESISNIFNLAEEKIILPYLNITYKIKSERYNYELEELIKDIKTLANDEFIRKCISDYIEVYYIDVMDKKTKEISQSKKINPELQFTDEHVKILLKVIEIVRIVIPLLVTYCDKYNIEPNELLYDIYISFIREYQGTEVDMVNKLHRFVYSRVISTKYSDNIMWKLLTNKSENIDVMTNEYLEEIIVSIFPKVRIDKNLINLLDVVIKFKISYTFKKNHKITFKPVNLNQVDSEGLTQFDRWEISMVKKNESKIILNQLSIKIRLNDFLKDKKFGVDISNEEFNYYLDRIRINKFQTNLVFLFFARYFGSYQNLKNCDRKQYVYLTILLYKWLIKNNYYNLAAYLIALPDKLNEKRMTRNNKIMEIIVNSKLYKDLMNEKFKFITNIINNTNLIVKLIGNLTVSRYIMLVPFDKLDERDINLSKENVSTMEIECKMEDLADEVLNFLKII